MYNITGMVTSVCSAGSVIFMVLVAAFTVGAVWKKRRWMRENVVQGALYLIGITLILGSLFYLVGVFTEYRKGEEEYEALQEQVFAQLSDLEDEAPESEAQAKREEDGDSLNASGADSLIQDAEEQKKRKERNAQIMQGVRTLQESNRDVIGWIAFDNVEISYPIMQGEDNDYYLDHTFSGEENSSGSIFMEAANSSDFEDYHTIIYGHNMKNLSMFGRLKKYKTEDFYENHQYFTVYTESWVYRYHIFAYYDIPETDDIYTIGFGPDEQFQAFVNEMIRHSYYDTDVTVTAQDKVITLSTCSDEGNRFVIHAKRIESESDYE